MPLGAEKVTNGGYDIKGCYTAPPKMAGAITPHPVSGYAMWMSITDGWTHNAELWGAFPSGPTSVWLEMNFAHRAKHDKG